MAAKKIIKTALGRTNAHGPYRATLIMTSGRKSMKSVTNVVPPDRTHLTLRMDGGEPLEIITIGSKQWIRRTDGWIAATNDGDSVAVALLSMFAASGRTPLLPISDVVSATEKPSKNPRLRTFAVVVKDTPKNLRGTVVVQRSGNRLRSLTIATPGGRIHCTYAENRKIMVKPPTVAKG